MTHLVMIHLCTAGLIVGYKVHFCYHHVLLFLICQRVPVFFLYIINISG